MNTIGAAPGVSWYTAWPPAWPPDCIVAQAAARNRTAKAIIIFFTLSPHLGYIWSYEYINFLGISGDLNRNT